MYFHVDLRLLNVKHNFRLAWTLQQQGYIYYFK